MSSSNHISYIDFPEIQRITNAIGDNFLAAEVLADICRLNTLYMITKAGSGHIGTSFSSIDIVTWLWTNVLTEPNNLEVGDIYFSSKGHDVPAFYALLMALGKLEFENIHKLRRLHGLPGHPDIKSTACLVTNTGTLGMGISKARGMAMAKRLNGYKGRIFVLTGDGELQEGQIWESLQPTSNNRFDEITVIVDHNKIQSDKFVSDTSDLGNLEAKFKSFGFEVDRCDGHNMRDIKSKLDSLDSARGKPKVLIADTIKGKGVSFMEQIDRDGLYKFHAGAPSMEHYSKAFAEILSRINSSLSSAGIDFVKTENIEFEKENKKGFYLVGSYEDELVKIGDTNKNVIVLDGDLAVSCGLMSFAKKYPDRFVECGIAEQDMVSMAGGLALSGFIPIVHSLACFLAPRPNEQIYNNSSEQTKIVYVGIQAGLLPAGPGHSHQSVRDIAILSQIPNMILIEPSSEIEVRHALKFAVEENNGSTYIRLASKTVDLLPTPKDSPPFQKGIGTVLREGKDAVVISYGAVMLNQAIKVADILSKQGIELKVVNLPWLNFVDSEWLLSALSGFNYLFTIDNHFIKGGVGEFLVSELARLKKNDLKIRMFGISTIPECGADEEVMRFHGLDAETLAKDISAEISEVIK